MKIKEIVQLITHSTCPQRGVKYNLYSLPSFDEGKQCEHVLGEKIQSNKYIVPDKAILFNKLNVRFKRVWRIDDTTPKKICSTEFLPLVIDESKVDFQYCFYLLISDSITNYLCGQNTNTSGSHKRIDPKDFLDINISLPSLEEQRNIGKLLSDLDRKIALNRSINHNLEAMAKQLYDYWFVQFDFPNAEGKPYKSSGGKMVWNEELGRVIPEHWQVKPLQAIATVKKGSMITEVNATQGNVKVVAGGVTFSYYNGESNRPKNTITVSGSGANAGYINFWREPIFASDCTTVNCKDDIDTLLCLYGMQLFQEVLYNWAVGAAQPHVYPKQVGILPMVCVPTEIKQRIKKILLSINEQIGVNLDEIERLTKQRDELLPLLMNGQATVNSD